MKKMVLGHVQPVMVAALLLFWAYGPAAVIKNPWTVVAASTRRRLSIREQMTFPFEPLIARVRARRTPSAAAAG